MASFVATFTESNSLTAEFGEVYVVGGSTLKVATTEEWNSHPELIGERNIVYVYTDHEISSTGQPIAGFKVGDGLAYLIDLPFNDDLALSHFNDTTIHVTDEERAFWNNKVTAYIDAENLENLILTKGN